MVKKIADPRQLLVEVHNLCVCHGGNTLVFISKELYKDFKAALPDRVTGFTVEEFNFDWLQVTCYEFGVMGSRCYYTPESITAKRIKKVFLK